MICKICSSNTKHIFDSKILMKFNVKYFKCDNCGYLFTEEPFWLEEAYSRSINISDTGLLDRNISFSKMLAVLIYFNFNKEAKFLDYAGGYGVFTRLMRDIGFDFYWNDPFTSNLLAKGFEAGVNIDLKYELVTAFEVFEHLVNPKDQIEKMLQLSDTIVFSTELLPRQIPNPKDWWYYGFNHGQHISFYSENTLNTLAKQFRLNFYNVDGIHILTERKFNSTKLVLLKKLRNFGSYNFVKKNMTSLIHSDFINLKKLED